jgi:hypothetical protein
LGQGLKEFKNSIAGVDAGLKLPANAAPAQDENPQPAAPQATGGYRN